MGVKYGIDISEGANVHIKGNYGESYNTFTWDDSGQTGPSNQIWLHKS